MKIYNKCRRFITNYKHLFTVVLFGLMGAASNAMEKDVVCVTIAFQNKQNHVEKIAVPQEIMDFIPYYTALNHYKKEEERKTINIPGLCSRSELELFAKLLHVLFDFAHPKGLIPLSFDAVNNDNNEKIIGALTAYLGTVLDPNIDLFAVLAFAHEWNVRSISHAVFRVAAAYGEMSRIAQHLPIEFCSLLTKNHKNSSYSLSLIQAKLQSRINALKDPCKAKKEQEQPGSLSLAELELLLKLIEVAYGNNFSHDDKSSLAIDRYGDNNEKDIERLMVSLLPQLDKEVDLLGILALAHDWELRSLCHTLFRFIAKHGEMKGLVSQLPLAFCPMLAKNAKNASLMMNLLKAKVEEGHAEETAPSLALCMDSFIDHFIADTKLDRLNIVARKAYTQGLLALVNKGPLKRIAKERIIHALNERTLLFSDQSTFDDSVKFDSFFFIGDYIFCGVGSFGILVNVVCDTIKSLRLDDRPFVNENGLGQRQPTYNRDIIPFVLQDHPGLNSMEKIILHVFVHARLIVQRLFGEMRNQRSEPDEAMRAEIGHFQEQLMALSKFDIDDWRPFLAYSETYTKDAAKIRAMYSIINRYLVWYHDGRVCIGNSLLSPTEELIYNLDPLKGLLAANNDRIAIAEYRDEEKSYSVKIYSAHQCQFVRQFMVSDLQDVYAMQYIDHDSLAFMNPEGIHIYEGKEKIALLPSGALVTDLVCVAKEFVLVGYRERNRNLCLWSLKDKKIVKILERPADAYPVKIKCSPTGKVIKVVYSNGHVEKITQESLFDFAAGERSLVKLLSLATKISLK